MLPREIQQNPQTFWDDGLALKNIMGDSTPQNELFALIAERIRLAGNLLKLSRSDMELIFRRHSIFEGEISMDSPSGKGDYLLVETYHLIHDKVGKGALKIVYPLDLLQEGDRFKSVCGGAVEVVPPAGTPRWSSKEDPEMLVKCAMREMMTGESLSMSLKCQATGSPFSGSEGLILCGRRHFDSEAGRYFIYPVLRGTEEAIADDRALVNGLMNATSESLTRSGRIAHNKIVHAAETNSTLTSRLALELPSNVVEGHLRSLLTETADIIIGDEDMTASLRDILGRENYVRTDCPLAKAAAAMQMEHSLLLQSSRVRLREVLLRLPQEGSPTPAQYREICEIFFGSGEIQQNEDQLFHHREPYLRLLSVALSTRNLSTCGDPQILSFYIKTFLDNQRILMEASVLKRLPQGAPLAADWFERAPLLSAQARQRLLSLMPSGNPSMESVNEGFQMAVEILVSARSETPRNTRDPYWLARNDLLDLAICAVTTVGDVIPSVERIVFFTLPYTYECVTPKLGVVTRKPVNVCGSALRPQAMAVGAVMSIEIFLRRLMRNNTPLKGMSIMIEGLGNAGINVARIMQEKGAIILGVSDSKGAALKPGGFTAREMQAVIAHKSSGRSLNTFSQTATAHGISLHPGAPITLYGDPGMLKKAKADILVLTAIPGSVTKDNASDLRVGIVCELTGAAVTGEAKCILRDRQIHVIPDNIASSGGLLVSLSEMLQNSAGQNWDRSVEEFTLREQISRSLDAVLRLAKKHDVDLPTASDILALQRMNQWALFRERLETNAHLLQERIRSIGAEEHVLIVSDDDEDGVASAAIMHALISRLNPGAENRIAFASESLRSDALAELIGSTSNPIKHCFVVDRSYPVSEAGQAATARLAKLCRITIINNHTLPASILASDSPKGSDKSKQHKCQLDPDFWIICPQTLKSAVPPQHLSTALILKDLAQLLINDSLVLTRINWQAVIGSCLDMPAESTGEWQLFFSQFNPDRAVEAAKAIRVVTRAGGFHSAINALVGVERPDLLETNASWGRFVAEYRSLEERVQILVEKIIVENRRRPFTAHFFTHDEVASPTAIAGNANSELDFYHWISEHLTKRGNLSEKPIIVGQVVQHERLGRFLGVRIRSPRGVELMESGLPEIFKTGGLPNTAVARIPLDESVAPPVQFQSLVDRIWMKTTNPIYLSATTDIAEDSSLLGLRSR